MPGCSLELTNHFHYHSVHIRSLVVASIFISSSLHLGLPAAFAIRMLKEISDGLVVILIPSSGCDKHPEQHYQVDGRASFIVLSYLPVTVNICFMSSRSRSLGLCDVIVKHHRCRQ